jgi:hypothetical protein
MTVKSNAGKSPVGEEAKDVDIALLVYPTERERTEVRHNLGERGEGEDMFSHMYGPQQFASLAKRAEEGAIAAEELHFRVQDLEAKVNKLILINHALFELAEARLGITEQDLVNKVNEIDLRDGRLDGKVEVENPNVCERCGRSYSQRHNHCLYCGHVNPVRSVL